MIALDGASAVFNASVTIVRDIHDRVERVDGQIGRNCSFPGPSAAGRNADFFRFTFIRAVRVNRSTQEPGSFPSATGLAFAIGGGQKFFFDWFDIGRRADGSASTRQRDGDKCAAPSGIFQ